MRGAGRDPGPVLLAVAGATAAGVAYAWDLLRGEPLVRFGPAGVALALGGAVAAAASVIWASRLGGRALGEGPVLALASTVVFLVAGEGALRAGGYGHREAMFGRFLELVPRPHETGIAGGKPYRLSSQGFRDVEVPEQAAPGEVRILCLGDSSTFGFGVDVGQEFPSALERELSAAWGRPVQAVNAGFVSATSWQGRVLYEGMAGRFHERWVVAAFGHNDRWLRPVADAHGGTGIAVALVQQSRLAILATDLLSRVRAAPASRLVPRVEARAYGENLAAIATRARAAGARTILVALPDDPEMLEAADRARSLTSAGREPDALDLLRRVTRMKALCPYPEPFEELAAMAARAGRTDEAAWALKEARVRHKLAPRTRDEAAYRAALREAASSVGALALLFDPEEVRGRLLDICHPTPELHLVIAERIAGLIARSRGDGQPEIESGVRRH